MCDGLSPPLSTQPLHYGGEGERYKGPQEMLLQTNQYVLLCDVMGTQHSLLNCSWGHRGSRVAGKAPCLRPARQGGCFSAPAWVCSKGDGTRSQNGQVSHSARVLLTVNCRIPGLLTEQTHVHTAGPVCTLCTPHSLKLGGHEHVYLR